MLDPGLRGRRALLTGGASGLGKEIAVALAREGVAVVIADRQDAAETLRAIEATGGTAMQLAVDVATEDAVRDMVADAAARLGGLDLYVNAAAITRHEPALELSSLAWRETLDTNLAAAVFACREVGRLMAAEGSGSMLLLGSTVAHHPAHGEGAYRAAKVALRSYMETLAIELAPVGVRVNMLTPGAFRTPLTDRLPAKDLAVVERVVPLGRRGEPYELCATALLLLSDALSPYTTGADVTVDGGLHLHPLPLGHDALAPRRSGQRAS
jgi:3-oxoacyl-[acyl-carrier protein] reductase